MPLTYLWSHILPILMDYICWQGLKEEGYQHFCGHFRDRPRQPYRECNKCDLYRVEDKDRWESQGEGATEGLQKEVGKDKGVIAPGVLGIKRGS
ncbi:hypothetical protein EJ02DRAFT_448880 [Clathrospora elynae]|uniref:Uncharacterized protein n=1 Tax=Clathrospora elynae TaxID=706981 RepID=A0A6A5S4W3_9PLEO|nr:hypothetical protein EJ02DRAFT_448880 [Clathrospora elynae]